MKDFPRRFRNRTEAGRALARRLMRYADHEDVVVLALPRGGVPVAREIADALGAPLDVFIVRKLGTPGQPELAMGAIASGNAVYLNRGVISALGISPREIAAVSTVERAELERREKAYRSRGGAVSARDKTVILVDDGLATGASMRAAVQALRALRPAYVIVAVPVGATQTCAELGAVVDDVICLHSLEPFYAVGAWYDDFTQTTDEEVREILRHSGREAA